MISVDILGHFATVYITRQPVNAFDLALWKQLEETLSELERDEKIQGVVFISGLQRGTFSAGEHIVKSVPSLQAPLQAKYLSVLCIRTKS